MKKLKREVPRYIEQAILRLAYGPYELAHKVFALMPHAAGHAGARLVNAEADARHAENIRLAAADRKAAS
jgi:hypothetical protein